MTQNTPDIPIRKLGAANLGPQHLADHGINREEAAFLKAVVRAVNGELEGYSLLDSMRCIRTQYNVDEAKLINAGYLTKWTGVKRRTYYGVSPAGQRACKTSKKCGHGYGDIAASTPHRVGVALAREYYDRRDDIQWVDVARRESGAVPDVAAHDRHGDRVATVEVEAGQVTADPDAGDDVRPGIHDYEALRSDYSTLAGFDGRSVWVIRNHEVAATVLRALNAADGLGFYADRDWLAGVESGRVKLQAVQDRIDEQDAPGLDELLTFQQLRRRL